MRLSLLRFVFITVATLLLSGCFLFEQPGSIHFDKPTPLKPIRAELTPTEVWETKVGENQANPAMKFSPIVSGSTLYVVSSDGVLSALNRFTGVSLWESHLKTSIATGATLSNGLLYLGSRDGDVIAVQASNGEPIWKHSVSNQIFAPPAVSNGLVLVKAIDGSVSALDAKTGRPVWVYEEPAPDLVLQAGSTPQVAAGKVIVGTADGKLDALSLAKGELIWQTTIAFPAGVFDADRMVDVDADPIIQNDRIYAAAYQGNLANLSLSTGQIFWSRPLSSYNNFVLDNGSLYLTDTNGLVFSVNASSGKDQWKQARLKYRRLTAPALQKGAYLVIGDGLGVVHWLSRATGEIVGRVQVDKENSVIATPVVADNYVYILTRSGKLFAYRIN